MIIRAERISGAIMDLGGWLRNLGLEQYEAAFPDNAIDEKVLPRLTAEDLKELGVNASGIAASCLTRLRRSEAIRKRHYPKHLRQSTGLRRTQPSAAKSQ
jgi:hypothetical protein